MQKHYQKYPRLKMSFNLSVYFLQSPKGCWGNAPSNEIEKCKLFKKRLMVKVIKIQRKA